MSKGTRITAAIAVVGTLVVAWAFLPSPEPVARGLAAKAMKTLLSRARSGDSFPYDAAVARIDEALANRRARAALRNDDWLTLEQLAGGHMERARLTGDWNDFRHAEEALDRAFAGAPEGGGPHLTRAALDYALHRFDRIEPSLRAVEARAIVTADARRAVRSMRADVALQKGQYDEAGALYAELLEEARTRDAVVGAAGHRWQTGRRDEAETLLAEAEELASGSDVLTRAWVCLARGLLALDDARHEDALGHYRRGLELFPGWYLLEEHEAEVLALTGEEDRALAIYRRLIERTGDPEFMDAAAGILEERGERAEAAELRARAHEGHEARLAMFPEAAYGHALGHFLEHEGDAARAVEIAERNRDTRPNGEAWTQLAQAYLHAGRAADARAAITRVQATPYRSLELEETAATILATR